MLTAAAAAVTPGRSLVRARASRKEAINPVTPAPVSTRGTRFSVAAAARSDDHYFDGGLGSGVVQPRSDGRLASLRLLGQPAASLWRAAGRLHAHLLCCEWPVRISAGLRRG